ncbi:hypothetical protein X884_3931 [Burkholderia pseudomallei MSHR4308]|nr:hypothetical protein X883_1611 [Burkholderia pseudomallei MSHR4304]KGV30491.1 hypothetical protein X884_3931 [Burkholderia pseudomallei MSHR4308]
MPRAAQRRRTMPGAAAHSPDAAALPAFAADGAAVCRKYARTCGMRATFAGDRQAVRRRAACRRRERGAVQRIRCAHDLARRAARRLLQRDRRAVDRRERVARHAQLADIAERPHTRIPGPGNPVVGHRHGGRLARPGVDVDRGHVGRRARVVRIGPFDVRNRIVRHDDVSRIVGVRGVFLPHENAGRLLHVPYRVAGDRHVRAADHGRAAPPVVAEQRVVLNQHVAAELAVPLVTDDRDHVVAGVLHRVVAHQHVARAVRRMDAVGQRVPHRVADDGDVRAAEHENASARATAHLDVEHLNARARHVHLRRSRRREPRRARADQRDADERRILAAHLDGLIGIVRRDKRRAVAGYHDLRILHEQRTPDDILPRRKHEPLAGLQRIERRLQRVGLIAAVARGIDDGVGGRGPRLRRAAGGERARGGESGECLL